MKIVERREHGNAWWGRTRDGAWFRWSMASAGWEGPFTPPWAPSGPPGPVEQPADASQASRVPEGSEPPPRNPVDAWWNRVFPPFSIRRLAFFLGVLPVMAGLQELIVGASGRDPSLPRFLFVEKQDLDLPRTSFGKDFLVALPFASLIVLIVHLITVGRGETFTGPSLATVAVASTGASVMVALRSSVWSLVLFSVAGGVLGGLAVVFLSVMTFSGTGWVEFAVGWILGSILLFTYAYPVWRGLRNMEARGVRLPMWIVMGGSVIVVSGAALMFVFER
ncbi:MAG: hypothetical protein M3138_02105 [Actinomycetota bacterium]|nr:hypothetical protein [Actinomycetota bacterium]